MAKQLSFFQKNHALLSIIFAVLLTQVFEIILIIVKYDLFTGGFLQPYVYKNISEYVVFFIASMWFDFALFSLLAMIWYSLAKKFNKQGAIVSFYFFVTVMSIILGLLALKFELLSRFKDRINLTIINNLGGNNVMEAIAYAANEIMLLIIAIIIGVLIVYFTSKWLKTKKFFKDTKDQTTDLTPYKKSFLIFSLITIIFCYAISTSPFYRFGLTKKISYSVISKILNKISDVDFDGYGIFYAPKDIAPFDSSRYLQDFHELLENTKQQPVKEEDKLTKITPQKGRNIILIVMESTRNDLLDVKVKDKFVAPHLRDLMQSGTRIPYAYSHTGYTSTSLKALFNRNLSVKDKMSLVDYLDKSGYQLSFFSGQDDSFGNIDKETGLDETKYYHFDSQDAIEDRVFPSTASSSLKISEQRLITEFKKQVKTLNFNTPQFIYFNFQAAHFPYNHKQMPKRLTQNPIPRRKINAKNKDWLALTYWNALSNVDWAVGEIVAILKQYQVLDNTTIMILGDHGESLFDDGVLGHGYMISDTQTQIPLVINDPNIRINSAIGQTDLAEMLIRSAFKLENKWLDSNKAVFQYTGLITNPSLIAEVKNKGERIIYNFDTNLFFFTKDKKWFSMDEVINDQQKKTWATALILNWKKRYEQLIQQEK